MTQVKICGITNLEDARHAADCGADALGFIFHPQSPRCVSPEGARDIVRALPREVAKVGVFVNRDFREVKWIAAYCGLDFIQLHGDESPEYCRHFPASVLIKAVAPREGGSIRKWCEYPVKALLADARDEERYGGTGKTTDWALARKIGESVPLILAGGLHRDNVEEAVEAVAPRAVDFCSGVEASPGRKDLEKVREAIAAVRAMKRDAGENIFGVRGRSLWIPSPETAY